MRRSVYRELTKSMLGDCRSAIVEFSASHHNRDVFAFALDCDPFHGDVTIGINTERGAAQVLRERYPKAKQGEILGLHGIRFRCEDFAFNDFGLSEESLQLLDEIAAAQHDAKTDRTAERHAEMLLLTLARVVIVLDPELEALDQTDDFISFVSERGASESARIASMRRTISPEAFDTVFPEISRFEKKLKTIAQLQPEQRAGFWVDMARDLACEHDTEEARRFRETGKSSQELLEIVTDLGSVSVAPLLNAMEETSLKPQLNRPRTKAYRQHGLQSLTCKFTLQALDTIRAIRLVDEENIARLHALLRKLHRRDKGKKAGPVAVELARVLHEMRPLLYPEPQVDERTLSLKNAKDFGLK